MAIHVVVTCSKRKKYPRRAVRLSGIRGNSVEERAKAWIEALASDPGPVIRARDLYLGEQWSLLRGLEQEAALGDVRYWVLSAGYGLVSFDAQLRSYAATFSRDHPESVFDPRLGISFNDAVRRWWSALAHREGPAAEPRSLQALVKCDPHASVMVAASPIYLRAIRADLDESADRMRHPQRMLVFSGGSDTNGASPGPVLSFDGRLQDRVGGSLMALNVRILAAVLRQGGSLDRPAVQQLLNGWMEEAPRRKKYDRAPAEDAEVRLFIQDELAVSPSVRWSPLLRKFRDEHGKACEQKRFRRLFQSVSEQLALID